MAEPSAARVRRLLGAAWHDPRFLVRFWTAFIPLALAALLIRWLT
jgi:hypothetical protein